MTLRPELHEDEDGAAAIELAFALPILIMLIWMMVQLGEVFQAAAGMQHALGEGARYATLCLNPTNNGCTTPSADAIADKMNDAVYGIGPGTFAITPPAKSVDGSASYYDLTVSYSQGTSLLFLPGPTISFSRSKRVWVAGS